MIPVINLFNFCLPARRGVDSLRTRNSEAVHRCEQARPYPDIDPAVLEYVLTVHPQTKPEQLP